MHLEIKLTLINRLNVARRLKEKQYLKEEGIYQSRFLKNLFLTHLGVSWDLLDKNFFLPWMPGTKGWFVKEEVVNHSLSRKLEVLWQLQIFGSELNQTQKINWLLHLLNPTGFIHSGFELTIHTQACLGTFIVNQDKSNKKPTYQKSLFSFFSCSCVTAWHISESKKSHKLNYINRHGRFIVSVYIPHKTVIGNFK